MTVDSQVPVTGPTDILAAFATAEFQRDPYPLFRRLRETEPIHKTGKGFYLALRHSDSSFVLSEIGGIFRAPKLEMMIQAAPQITEHPALWALATCMMARNPPEHTRLRRLVARYFTPRAVDKFTGHIEQVCDRLMDAIDEPLRDGEVVDMHRAVSQPMPLLLIAELLGVPESDHGWLTTAVHDIGVGLTSAATAEAPELLIRADEQTVRMESYFRDLAAHRRAAPGEDLISGLTQVRNDDPERLTDDELVNLVWLLWLGGTEANMVMTDHCVSSILEFPDECSWLRGDHASAIAFVDEVFRRTPSVIFSPLSRPTTRDVEIGGVTYPAGTDIKPCFASANRDPEVFPDPDRFDPSRDNASEHLTLSAGIHHCLGAFLSRTALAMTSARLHTRFPTLSNLDEPRWGGLSVDPATRRLRVALDGSR